MEGLTYLQLPGEATIRLVSVSQPSTVVYENANQAPPGPDEGLQETSKPGISLDGDGDTLNTTNETDKLSTEGSSSAVLIKEEFRCLLCLQPIENTGAGKEVISKNAKVSFADFCKLLNVTVPPSPKNVLRKLHAPLCKKCLDEMIKIRELVSQIEKIELCLVSTRSLLKEQVLASYGTHNCDNIDDMQGSAKALIDVDSITCSIRNSIRNDASEGASISILLAQTRKKRGRKPGKKQTQSPKSTESEAAITIPAPTPKASTSSCKSSFGRVVKRPPRYFMMNDNGSGLKEKKSDSGYFIPSDNSLGSNENEHSFITDSEDQAGNDAGLSKEVTSTGENMTEFKIQSVRGNYSNLAANAEKRKESTKKRRGRKAKDGVRVPPPPLLHQKIDEGACGENPACGEVISKKSNLEGTKTVEKVQQVDKRAKGRKTKVIVPKTKPPHKCNKCKRTFADKRDRDRHMLRIHEGLKEDFECRGCDKKFTKMKDLLRHRKKEHPPKVVILDESGRKLLKCASCVSVFKNYSDLQIHHRSHTGDKPFKCDQCDESFTSKGRYEVHVEMYHRDLAPLKCEYCPRSFFRHHRLYHHKNTHTGVRHYLCEICSKAFSQPAYLKYHQTKHKELDLEEYKCEHCDKSFASPVNLRLHKETQHQKKYRYYCATCGHGATHKSHLKLHELSHTGERPHVCEYCQKTFTRASQLKIHVRSHTGEKPYLCKTCPKCFTNSSKLRRHELTHAANKAKKQQNTVKSTQQTDDQQNEQPQHSGTALTTTALAVPPGISLPTDFVNVQVEEVEATSEQALLKIDHAPGTVHEQDIQPQFIAIQEPNGVTYQIIATDGSTGNEPYTEYILLNSNYTFA